MRTVRNIATILLFTIASFEEVQAAKRVVGACLAGQRFATIQAAIQASTPGDTVQVCPGNYAEQVIINIPLTLEGVKSGASQAAVITGVPALAGSIAAQILVQNTSGVTVSGIIVDGTADACTDSVYGIGLYGATAFINNSVVRNVTGTGTNACPGRAIGAFNGSELTVKNSIIHDCYQGISTSYSTANIANNTIVTKQISINLGSTSGPLTITNNFVNAGIGCTPPDCEGEGIGIYQAPATISNNTINLAPNAQGLGIDIEESQNARVVDNKVSGAWQAISLTNCTTSVVAGNILRNSGYVALTPYDYSPGGNIITNNSVEEAPCGMNLAAAKGDTLAPNTYYDTVLTTCN